MRRLALCLALATACSHVMGDIRYGKTAEEDYRLGEAEFKSKSWPEAQKYFEHVRTKYPYSKWAPLADLRLADMKFEQERFVESADAYKQWVKMHPTNEEADYASFRAAVSYWKDGPTDFLLFPPSFEKDLGQVRAAAAGFEEFLRAHPTSKYVPEATRLLAEARGKLAEHEWYVAQFYKHRSRWPAVAGRLESLVRDYPGSRYETDALFELAHAYLQMDERFRARQALQQLVVKHPKDPRRAEAERLLASIR